MLFRFALYAPYDAKEKAKSSRREGGRRVCVRVERRMVMSTVKITQRLHLWAELMALFIGLAPLLFAALERALTQHARGGKSRAMECFI
jgi:hypothetical protein